MPLSSERCAFTSNLIILIELNRIDENLYVSEFLLPFWIDDGGGGGGGGGDGACFIALSAKVIAAKSSSISSTSSWYVTKAMALALASL